MRRKRGMGMRGERWLRWELERISNRIEFIGEGKGVTSQTRPLWAFYIEKQQKLEAELKALLANGDAEREL